MELKCGDVSFLKDCGLGINKAADWRVSVSLFTRTNGVDTPIDLTGYTGRSSMKANATDTTATATISVAIEGENHNIITLSMDSTATALIPTTGRKAGEVTRYQYDVLLTKGAEQYRVLAGGIDVSPNITSEA